MTRSENMEHVEVLRHMKETIKAIMPSEVAALDAAIASLSAPQPPAEVHCATCDCVPGMTPAIRFDTTPAEREGEVRDHLIRMGWTPPAEAQERPAKPAECADGCPDQQVCDHCQWPPGPDAEVQPVGYDKVIEDALRHGTGTLRVEHVTHDDFRPPPSALGGVGRLVAKWRERVRGMEGSWDDKTADGYRVATEDCANDLEDLAQQPAAVDGESVVVPRWFMEKLAKDTRDIGMFEMSAAIRRVALSAQPGGSDNDR